MISKFIIRSSIQYILLSSIDPNVKLFYFHHGVLFYHSLFFESLFPQSNNTSVRSQAIAQSAIISAVSAAGVGGLLVIFFSHCIVEVNARSLDD